MNMAEIHRKKEEKNKKKQVFNDTKFALFEAAEREIGHRRRRRHNAECD